MQSKLIAPTAVALLAIVSLAASQTKLDGPDKVKSTKAISGKVTGFEVGDFTHALVKDAKGHSNSYYIGPRPELLYFLASHAQKRLELKIQVVDTYIEQAAKRMVIDQIADARMGKLTSAGWWKSELRHGSATALGKKYDKLVEKLTKQSGAPLRFSSGGDPVVLAVNGWIIGVKRGAAWTNGTKALGGKRMRFANFTSAKAGRPVLIGLEYSDGPPEPSLDLKGVDEADPPTVYVSGGKVRFAAVKRIDKKGAAYLADAKRYAASKGKGKLPLEIQDGIETDLSADAKPTTVLAIGSGATLSSKKTADYAAVIACTTIGGKPKTIELGYESRFGEMRGPFTSRIIAAGDFDGGHHVQLLISMKDPWGEEIRLLELTKSGALKQILKADRGE